MRKALVVGIDFYSQVTRLHGCVNDAYSVKSALARNGDGTVNFDVKILAGTGETDPVQRSELREAVQGLFDGECEVALFYFAGHGYIDSGGGYLLASDSETGDDGLSLNEVLVFATQSKSKNKIVVLDSCHSGIAGSSPPTPVEARLNEGVTILTASTAEQYAEEENGCGVFTALLVDALDGAAGNLLGDVTPGSVYAHIDQSLGPWEQRPIFKTNVKSFVSLRKVHPPIALQDLQRIVEFFPERSDVFQLDPTFEPERTGKEEGVPPPDDANTEKFSVLQRYNRVNLVVPVGAPHMWHAAMEGKSCKLTVLGEHYHHLVKKGRI